MGDTELPQAQGNVLEGDIDVDGAGGMDDMAAAQAELEAMKARLAQMETDAARMRTEPSAGEGDANARSDAGDQASREEADSRSIYVGNVDYACTPEELQQHFQGCGTVNRVTILTDKFGSPKGFAYLEFLEGDAVANAVLLDNSELRARNIKVAPKRTNVPGLKPGFGGFRGRGFSPRGRGGRFPPRGRGGYMPYGGGYDYYGGMGYPPRGRGRGRYYSPY